VGLDSVHVVVGCPLALRKGVDRENGVYSNVVDDFLAPLGWEAAQAEVTIVTTPLRQLNAVYGCAGPGVWHVQNGDTLSLLAQRLPKWRAGNVSGGQAPRVGTADNLLPTVESGWDRSEGGEEAAPERADDKADRVACRATRRGLQHGAVCLYPSDGRLGSGGRGVE